MRRFLIAVALLLLSAPVALAQAPATHPGADTLPYLDERLSFEARATDLVARMTLAEKVSQMRDLTPAIDRLGVPAYNWWNEALHGVARSGLATVFPQAIGLAATWDTSLMFRVATAISDEGRAKYHEALRRDIHARYAGLTFWSPNINIFRDPRWGRGQETYGEDPFLTGALGVQFIRGLQGDDPKYYKTVATVKHYAVHSGPETERHAFDALVSERDLRESYLPQFEQGIREGHAYSLMCAYNRINGVPACASRMLIRDVLRGEWRFPGFIVSDCGAIDNIYLRHKVVATAAEAAALAVRTGTDLDCGRVYPNLVDAVGRGLITQAEIDTSATRLVLARMKLGMFDAPGHVRWSRIPYSVVDQPSHRALARSAARKAIVLLKNDTHALPLRKDLRTIAVIGPNADDARMLYGNYSGEPSSAVTPLQGIRAAARGAEVLYARGSDLAEGFPVSTAVPASVLATASGAPGAQADVFKGIAFDGPPVFSRTDSAVQAVWGDRAPRADMPADSFSVRWTTTLRPTQTGRYTLGLVGTMRFRLVLDDSTIARSRYTLRHDEYPDPRSVMSAPLTLQAGRAYRVVVEATDTYEDARIALQWTTPSDSLEVEAVRAAKRAEVVILALGLTARLEGEEMGVNLPGFRGGDRTSLDLPAPQQRLLERIVSLGKPTVLLLLNGSALGVTWAHAHVPAIVEAWYPGQAGGTAIADVLFGDYNPAGRLPVTFYRDTAGLPPFNDYRMTGRTYRYFTGAPLYAFGHGLSYTTFRYRTLRVSGEPSAERPATVSVDVTNTGPRAGDEVVQLYVRYPRTRVARAVRELRGFRRVTLKPGQTRRLTFPLSRRALAYWNDTTHAWTIEPGTVRVEVGASSADIRLSREITMRAGAP